jgi:hypothetical protein
MIIIKEAEKILKYKDMTLLILSTWNVKNESDSINNRGNWNHLTVIQKMCEKHTWKAKEVHKTAIMGTAHIF